MLQFLGKPPRDIDELMIRAQWLAGFTLGETASLLNLPVPADLKRDKGWVGNLLELALGATAGSKAEQDFATLGVELKTIPVDNTGKVLETTFVSLAPLTQNHGLTWESSHFRQKLACVLWIPVEGMRDKPLAERQIGQPVLWQATPEEEHLLRQDWEELMELIVLGRLKEINGHLGNVLQLRPKGQNRLARTEGIDDEGNRIQTLPLAFYLRRTFTQAILDRFLLSY